MIDTTFIMDWLKAHSGLMWILSVISLVVFLGTLAIIPYFIVRIPEDYLVRERSEDITGATKKRTMRFLCMILKNLLGILLVITGFFMFFIPGQGVITMVIGIMLMNFPGKRSMSTAIIRQPTILKSLNWTRAKALRPPLILPPE
ncbi:MAG: hypothetical protein JXB42_06770 [Deltaproteobacteria bacterium]|nr:hypothetical protein [Deltaproteobacteria bacterium]